MRGGVSVPWGGVPGGMGIPGGMGVPGGWAFQGYNNFDMLFLYIVSLSRQVLK